MSARPPRAMFYVQHLLGIGHLKRAATIARAMAASGFDVTLVSGGHPVPGLDTGAARLVQLEPMRAADKSFKVLVDEADRPIDDAYRDRRRRDLLSCFDEAAPDVLITELFPFGRRQLSYELIPLLEHARAMDSPPKIVCSVRDILVEPPKRERVEEMLDRVRRFYDLVLVHGDPTLIPFGETFPLADKIADRLRYTGYVVDTGARGQTKDGVGEVIVSAGGGAVSDELFAAAMAARAQTQAAGLPWRVLVGHAAPEDSYQRVRAAAGPGIVVERARSDFTALLANCLLSVSQGGYNTVMEVMAAGTRGVIVPYAGGLETEQTLRAQLLAERAGLHIVPEQNLGADAIAEAIDTALNAPPARADALDMGGAARTSDLLWELAQGRSAAVR